MYACYVCLLVVSVLPFVLRVSRPLPHDRAVSVLPTCPLAVSGVRQGLLVHADGDI